MNTIYEIVLMLAVFGTGLLKGHAYAERRSDRRQRILEALFPTHEKSGLDLVAEGRGKRGTIYLDLSALEDDGLVASWTSDTKRAYRLTDKGRKRVESHAISNRRGLH